MDFLIWYGGRSDLAHLEVYGIWGSVAGSLLQLLIQLPVVLRLAPAIRLGFALADQNVRIVITDFFPVFFSRGVVQLSAFVDTILASPLPSASVAALGYAQTDYLLT